MANRTRRRRPVPATDTFARNLRLALDAAGLTQRGLGLRADVHFVTVSRVLSGHVKPTLDVCQRLAIGVGVRLCDLLDENFDPE